MAGGKATGKDLEYQRTCRDVWIHRSGDKFKPYAGTDGLDVQIVCGGTTWTFDILLEDEGGALHVGEAKRWASAIPQDAVRAFAGKVADLQDATNKEVTGVFFAKTDAQPGALAVAQHHGVLVVVSGEHQALPAFGIAVLYPNPAAPGRRKRRHSYEVHVVDGGRGEDRADATDVGPDDEKA